MILFSPETLEALHAAGWRPDRRADDLVTRWRDRFREENGLEMPTAAESALRRFGGLRIQQRGDGVDFSRTPLVFDPELAIGAEVQLQRYGQLMGEPGLFPLGEAADQAFLAIAATGHVYLIFEGILLVGGGIDEAISNLLEGRKVPGAEWQSLS